MNFEQDQPEALEVIQPSAIEAMERASVDVQITTAKRFPRSIEKVKRDMMRFATMDQETAAGCFYKLKRKDKDGSAKFIEGPSVRMAEIAVACYQNLRASTRIVGNDGKKITAQSVCHDLENNTAIGWETHRRITGTNGKTFSDDMQIVTGNAAAAIAFRNAVFKVIPRALINPVFEQCKVVAVGQAKSIAERRNKMLEAFSKMNVAQDQILSYLEKTDVDEIDMRDIETLIGVHTALKDGTTTIDEQFPATAVKGDGPLLKHEKEKDTAATATATATQQQSDTPKQSSVAQLQSFIESIGFDFVIFSTWAELAGQIPEGSKWASWDDISEKDATRFMRAQAGLKKNLGDIKAAGEKQ